MSYTARLGISCPRTPLVEGKQLNVEVLTKALFVVLSYDKSSGTRALDGFKIIDVPFDDAKDGN